MSLSLKDRIRAAKTTVELDALLAEGERYENASKGTRGKWRRAWRKRLEELQFPAPEKPKPAKRRK